MAILGLDLAITSGTSAVLTSTAQAAVPPSRVELYSPFGRLRTNVGAINFHWSIQPEPEASVFAIQRKNPNSGELEHFLKRDLAGLQSNLAIDIKDFPIGDYQWSVSSIDSQTGATISTQSESFTVESMSPSYPRSPRLGTTFGLMRTKIISENPNFSAETAVQESIAGAHIAYPLSDQWRLGGTLRGRDLVLRGELLNSFEIQVEGVRWWPQGQRRWGLVGQIYRFDTFAVAARTPSQITTGRAESTMLNVGVDYEQSFASSITWGARALFGTETLRNFNPANSWAALLEGRVSSLQFWPIEVGVTATYTMDRIAVGKIGAVNDIVTSRSGFGALINVRYVFSELVFDQSPSLAK
ncbi:MAG TPA: hypothetical protein PLZ57_15270 [Pseudobdellovibrionaceae bacterium]|nr:hypothetical protein [Pseudobdellovibrionaceae bacterium]